MARNFSFLSRSETREFKVEDWGFDETYYLKNYPDVALSGANPRDHYSQYGWKEGRDPSDYFSTSGYLARNPDVAAAAVNPLDHFIKYGASEQRTGWRKRSQEELHTELRGEFQALKDEFVRRSHLNLGGQDSRSATDAPTRASISARAATLPLTPRAKTLFCRLYDIASK